MHHPASKEFQRVGEGFAQRQEKYRDEGTRGFGQEVQDPKPAPSIVQ